MDCETENIDQEQEWAIARLDALGQALEAKRKEAVDFRAQSGIETIWEEDQDFYDEQSGIVKNSYEKPSTLDGRLTAPRKPANGKSTVFYNITQSYVDMAAARVADMLLPNDDKPFALEPTPIAEIEGYEESDELQTFPDGTQAPAKEVVKMVQAAAAEAAEADEEEIWDWLVETQWHSEVRRVIEDAARIGTGVLKGPTPYIRKKKQISNENGVVRIDMVAETKPQSRRICVTNLYPDPACGENIHNGAYIWEKDYLTRKQLLELKGGDYLDAQIDKCLKEGPDASLDPKAKEEKEKLFEVWYYHGLLEEEDFRAAGCECDREEMPAVVIMVNARVIKAAISPLDSGDFPYDILPWQKRGGTWAGTGVGRQVRTAQRIVNAATRKMLDNAGLSAGPIKFFRKSGVEPASGQGWDLTPDKTFFVDPTETRSVRDMLHFVEIPNLQERFAAIAQYGLDLAERVTSMPLLMQGQQGSSTETVGGMQILQNNAGSVLRRLAKLADDQIFTPHVQRYYEWLLLYGKNNRKRDAVIRAKGSSAFYERDAQDQSILQMAAIVKDPAFDINPKKWIIEALRAQKLDPVRLQYTEEEKAEMAQQQPGVDPRVAGNLEVAKIRTEGDLQKAKLTQESDMAELQLKEKIELSKLTSKAEQDELQRQHDLAMKTMEYEMKVMEFSVNQGISLDVLKAKLADTSMKLNTQRDLTKMALANKQQSEGPSNEAQKPASEPEGKAPDGESYPL